MINSESEKFLIERIALEKILNSYKYRNEVAVGSLVSHSLNRIARHQSILSLNGLMLSLVWLFVNSIRPKTVGNNKRLYLKPSNDQRTNRQFDPLQKAESPNKSQFILINDFFKGFHVLLFVKSLYHASISLEGLNKVLRSDSFKILKKNDVKKIKFIFVLQAIKYDIAKSILETNKVKSVCVDLDRSFFGAPIILAAQILKIKNATLVHGSVFPPYLYVPIIADTVFCWGHIQINLFKKFTTKHVEYIDAGSLASNIEPLNKDKSEKKILTFVSQNFSTGEQYDVINELAKVNNQIGLNDFEIYIKAHPADDFDCISSLCTNSNLKIWDESISLSTCIQKSSVFLVISSAFVFDAVGMGRPVLFYDTESGQSDLALLFNKGGNALIVNDSTSLVNTLIDPVNVLTNYNLKLLMTFHKQYISSYGMKSAEIVVGTLS